MSSTKEFSIQIDDRPGTLAKSCRALANHKVSILAFEAYPVSERKSLARFVVDNPAAAKQAFEAEGLKYTETEVAQVRLPNRMGALAEVASHLGEANVNIMYGYCGLDLASNVPFLILGVPDVGKTTKILDQALAAVAR